MRKYKCSICGYVYDESKGIPENGISPSTRWEDLPDDFLCPICRAPKSVFNPLEEPKPTQISAGDAGNATPADDNNTSEQGIKELSAGEISAICSSLAKGCEKQRLMAEMEAFYELADYYKLKSVAGNGNALEDAVKMLDDDLSSGYATANDAAKTEGDRGALRSLVWSEKVSIMMNSLLDQFAKEGTAMLENTKIYVCDICGFIYIGDAPPEICPICKVPNHKIIQVERR